MFVSSADAKLRQIGAALLLRMRNNSTRGRFRGRHKKWDIYRNYKRSDTHKKNNKKLDFFFIAVICQLVQNWKMDQVAWRHQKLASQSSQFCSSSRLLLGKLKLFFRHHLHLLCDLSPLSAEHFMCSWLNGNNLLWCVWITIQKRSFSIGFTCDFTVKLQKRSDFKACCQYEF